MEAAKFGGVAAKICQKILDVVFGIHAVWGNYLKIYFWLCNLFKKNQILVLHRHRDVRNVINVAETLNLQQAVKKYAKSVLDHGDLPLNNALLKDIIWWKQNRAMYSMLVTSGGQVFWKSRWMVSLMWDLARADFGWTIWKTPSI